MLAERLAKRMKHLVKWGRKQGISCFRLYERDIPEFPLIIDWYAHEDAVDYAHEGDAIIWFRDRKKDETLEQSLAYRRTVEHEVLAGLGIDASQIHLKYRGRQRDETGGREQYERLDTKKHEKVVVEHDARFIINLSDYLDVGLFLDHRPTRRAVRERAEGKSVLNLFAYTGAFSVHARAGGAIETTTVDMSKTYLDWYERNLAENSFALDADHVAVHADCLQWLEEQSADRKRFDIIICDPPTFSNSKRMKKDSFSIDRDHSQLISKLTELVAPGGEIYFSTNARGFTLDEASIDEGFGVREISNRSVPDDFRNREIHRCWRIAEGWISKPR